MNAGDGWHEHPTQALLDAFSVREALCAAAGPPLGGVRCGGVRRAARAHRRRRAALARRAQRDARLPHARRARDALRPGHAAAARRGGLGRGGGARTSTTRSARPTWSRCCGCRPSAAAGRTSRRSPSTPRRYGLTERRAALLKPDAVVTHPGPMTRGVEIASSVADGGQRARHPPGAKRRRGAHGDPVPRPRRRALLASRAPRERAALLVEGGSVVAADGVRRADVLVVDGRIAALGERIDAPGDAAVLDASGCAVGPGLVDLHAHLREPGARGGRDDRDGREGRRRSAATPRSSRCPTPSPPATRAAVVARRARARPGDARCDVAVAGAITVGRRGESLAPMAEMAALGVTLFTDDGACVADGDLMRRALEYAGGLGGDLRAALRGPRARGGRRDARGRVVLQARPPRPARPRRDARSSRATSGSSSSPARRCTSCTSRCPSRSGSSPTPVAAGSRSPARSPRTTSRLDDEPCATYDPAFKVNPPLRTAEHVDGARRRSCATARSTPWRPTTRRTRPRRKDRPFDDAAFGMLGLQHALGLTVDALGGPDVARPRRSCSTCSRGGPRRSRGSRARGSAASRATAPTAARSWSARSPTSCVVDLAAPHVVTRRRRSRAGRTTARTSAARCPVSVRHTVLRGIADGARRGGDAMSATPRTSSWPTAPCCAGEAAGFAPADGRRDRRARLQHGDERLPRGPHRPELRGPGRRLHLPHVGNYGVTPLDEESPRPACTGLVVRELASTRRAGARSGRSRAFLVQHRVAAITGRRHAAADTARSASVGAVGCAFGTAPVAALLAEAAARAATTDGRDLVTEVTCTTPYTLGDGPLRVVALDYGIKATIVRQLAARFTRHRRARRDDRRRDPRPRARTACSSPTAPATPPRSPAPRDVDRGAPRRRPDLRDLPRPAGPRRGPGGEHLQARLRPPRLEPPGAPPRRRGASR